MVSEELHTAPLVDVRQYVLNIEARYSESLVVATHLASDEDVQFSKFHHDAANTVKTLTMFRCT